MIEPKELMVHIEHIVRPLRATERRKLRMRRELLGHLQSALEEERERGLAEKDALAAAKARLGAPEELTRSLQRSVPRLERVLLGRVPLGESIHRWERKLGIHIGMGGMSLGQQGLMSLGAMIFCYGTAVLMAMRTRGLHRDAMMQRLADQVWQFQFGNIVSGILLILLMGSAYGIVGAAARGNSWQKLARHGVWIALWLLLWQVDLVTLITGQWVSAQDVACAAAAALLLAAGLAWVGRLTLKMGGPYREWLTLDIAS